LAAELDWDEGRAGAEIEDRPAAVPDGEEVGDEDSVYGRVVHRVVVARLLGRVHHFRFEHAGQHRALSISWGGGVSLSVRSPLPRVDSAALRTGQAGNLSPRSEPAAYSTFLLASV